ncbi:MAG: Protein kinase [Thermomicrobiales bacterium]|nr:Protein kinase [Thermomicrobiales bacterium]
MGANDIDERRATLRAFGHLLKRLRAEADLTQEELAERAGISVRSISDLERGPSHLPRRDTVQLLADGLRLRGAERDRFIALARGRSVPLTESPPKNGATRRTLPYPPTPIVGRLKETAAATSRILDSDERLLTLTGPGGVGKTRLALEVGHRVSDAFPGGAVFVDLAPVRDADLVLSAIAQAVRVTAGPEVPLRQALYDALHDERLLLILDNFEHVPAAAVAVAELLAACPRVTALVTSRTPLRIRAEREYPVGPLALPEPETLGNLDELARVPAIELFVHRAEVANPRFALTTENAAAVTGVVERLDGLPLAIELAATRMKILSPAALLARMEQRLPLLTRGAHDLPERQQAMRATLDWSHDLLSPEEQTLFRRLAVFAGGCTVDAAEYVGGEGGEGGKWSECTKAHSPLLPAPRPSPSSPPLVIDLLADLVDKSLLRTADDLGDDRRFGMLETIREYGLERLAEVGEEDEIRRRHQTWCVDLAERAEPELIGADQHRWFSRLAIEHDNVRVALGWAISRGDAETALRLGGALYRFWADHGHYEEGRRWLEQALALAPGAVSIPRGNALLGLGVMVYFQGDYDRAEALWEESLTLFRGLGHTVGIAYSHGNLGLVADAKADYPRAIASYEQALALFRELDDTTYIGYMLHNLGLIAFFQEDYARARALFAESLALARTLRDENSVALVLGNLGLVAFAEGDYEQALRYQQQALANWRAINNKHWLVSQVERFALIAAATGDGKRAARLFGAAAALREAFGASLPPNDREINERTITVTRERIGEAIFTACWEDGARLSLEAAILAALGEDSRQSANRTGRRDDTRNGSPMARTTTGWEERGS